MTSVEEEVTALRAIGSHWNQSISNHPVLAFEPKKLLPESTGWRRYYLGPDLRRTLKSLSRPEPLSCPGCEAPGPSRHNLIEDADTVLVKREPSLVVRIEINLPCGGCAKDLSYGFEKNFGRYGTDDTLRVFDTWFRGAEV